MTRASVALAQMRRLRTWVSSRRSTTPNAPLKADRQEASVPLRADGSPVWAFRSPGLRIAAPARLPEAFHLSGVCRTGTPRSQLRDSSGFAPDSLGTRRKLNSPPRHAGRTACSRSEHAGGGEPNRLVGSGLRPNSVGSAQIRHRGSPTPQRGGLWRCRRLVVRDVVDRGARFAGAPKPQRGIPHPLLLILLAALPVLAGGALGWWQADIVNRYGSRIGIGFQ